MKQPAAKFTIDIAWTGLMETIGVSAEDLLRHAELPLGLFSQTSPELDIDSYFRLWHSLEVLIGDPLFPLTLGKALTPDAFSPPLFAAYCSPNLKIALERLSAYKPIICPMTMELDQVDEGLALTLKMPRHWELPTTFVLMEMVFIVNLARTATRQNINPVKVISKCPPNEITAYRSFFGIPVATGDENRIIFSRADTAIPFLSVNNAMFQVFEPVLNKRLAELERDSTLSDRVRTCLAEMMASGLTGIGDVADRLAMSQRTLQRRLAQEDTSFQTILNQVRTDIAKVYLQKTHYSNAEIAFLLGYDDPNSFIRAYHSWTGATPEASRQAMLAS